ncbi:nucleolar and spindle-associated protein 1 isoform X2 [Oryzias latipes]|uniref:nucleolar and spindle-associated protein 1 isoform X2 n=1 Tax=Oryzias latipes TaxID=8090 RepID=UPI000CE1A9A4|nr:nucleolar and spindle-associated protein 1 isoform X2 [Oryzias latipes]XP_023807448.1 nucleolar and spindle-associated protein 1 isoform X2 [Oryzias latipes]
MDLDSMKYADLRSLAKQLGLKANMKANKLLKAVKQHYKQQEAAGGKDDRVSHADQDAVKETSSPRVFVNARRGRGRRDSGKTTSGAAVTPKAARADAEPEASSSKTRRASKRRASSEQNSPEPQEELQPDACVEAPARVETEPEPKPKVSKAGKIPRYRGSQQKAALKPLTPNFKKLHEAHFKKMESIDTYVERKKRKVDTLKNPVKELKSKNAAGSSMFSPPSGKKPAEEKSRHTLLSASKAPSSRPAGSAAPFRPSVLSTRRINVRFSEATRDNEFKGSLLKTPARMSLCLVSSTPQAAAGAGPHTGRPSTFSAQKTPRTFVFNGNTSLTPGTQKKATFDLKASLARPLTYKPHAGKLKPFAEVKENAAANKSLNSHQESYKQHKVQTREDRRTQQAQGRKQKKESMLGARRGLAMM